MERRNRGYLPPTSSMPTTSVSTSHRCTLKKTRSPAFPASQCHLTPCLRSNGRKNKDMVPTPPLSLHPFKPKSSPDATDITNFAEALLSLSSPKNSPVKTTSLPPRRAKYLSAVSKPRKPRRYFFQRLESFCSIFPKSGRLKSILFRPDVMRLSNKNATINP